ncbi:MAG: glycosyltransferase family 39 protein [Cyanobacteria bacterium P01_A01_bin.114]
MAWSLPLLLAGFFNLAHQSLIAYDEGLYASRARLMLDTGDWVHPWDVLHHKTPGPYWLLALSMQILGQNEIAVRLPSVVASLVCILLTYEMGKRLVRPAAALWGTLSLSVTFLWLQYSRFATPDIVFTGGILLSIVCLLRAEDGRFRNSQGLRFIAGVCLGLGFLMRSFLAVLPMLCLAPYLLFEQRRHRHLSSPSLYIGFLTGLLPTLGWLYLCWQRFGGEIWQSLVAFPRRLGIEQSQSGENPLFYLLNLGVNDFPWVFFAIAGLYLIFSQSLTPPFFKGGRGGSSLIEATDRSPSGPLEKGDVYSKWTHWIKSSLNSPKGSSRYWLLAYPIFLIAILSTAATRMPHYALSAYPFLALLAGVAMDALIQVEKPRRSLRLGLKIINSILLSLGSLLIGLSLLVLMTDRLPIDRQEIVSYIPIAFSLGVGWVVTSQVTYNPSKWLMSLLLSHWVALGVAGATYQLGNANADLKAFLLEPKIQTVLQSEPINFSPDLGAKTGTLLRFYTPQKGQRLDTLTNVPPGYLWLLSQDVPKLPVGHQSVGRLNQLELVQILAPRNP